HPKPSGVVSSGGAAMADIVRRGESWDGFPTLATFNGMRQMMDRLLGDDALGQGWDEGMLPVDISEQGQQLIVRASVPGFAKDDIDVQVHQGVLSINAKHSTENETTDEKWYRRERRYGSVSRRIALPGIVHD